MKDEPSVWMFIGTSVVILMMCLGLMGIMATAKYAKHRWPACEQCECPE